MDIRKTFFAGGAIVAALAVAAAVPLQTGRTVNVTVVDAGNRPVANAIVCAGTGTNRGASDVGTTNAQGAVALTVPAAEASSGLGITPPGAGGALITASAGGRGTEATTGPLALVTLRLPASAGGPSCPTTAQSATAPGQFRIAPGAVAAAQARNAANPIGRIIGDFERAFRCFGAGGQNCNDQPGEVGGCIRENSTCAVSAGSWRHDECCAANPAGGMCDGDLTEAVTQVVPGQAQVCQADFNTAVARAPTPLTWRRRVDFAAVNRTGRVDHAAYCAPGGTLMPSGEDGFCCSRSSRAPDRIQAAGIAGLPLGGVPAANIRICN